MKVKVIMSCYNGSQFLVDQLESIYQQRGVDLSVFVRDDGSTDDSLEILYKFRDAHPDLDITILPGENLGVGRSFMTALHLSGPSDFYCFADQDDFWEEDKLLSSISKLLKHVPSDKPGLYYSNVEYADEKLKPLGISSQRHQKSMADVIFSNEAIGCTMVFNLTAYNLIMKSYAKESQNFPGIIHDWWINLVITSLGTTIFNNHSHIKYRQHSSNVVGGSNNSFATILKKINFFIKNGIDAYKPTEQASGLLEFYNDILTSEQKIYLKNLVNTKKHPFERTFFAVSKNVHRQKWLDQFVVRVLIALNLH